jgi:hypothetical protein
MKSDPLVWQTWAEKLNRWGIGDFVAALLEAAGPLTLMGAQVIYFGKPFMGDIIPARHLEALTDLLEDPGQTRAFTAFLREESSP